MGTAEGEGRSVIHRLPLQTKSYSRMHQIGHYQRKEILSVQWVFVMDSQQLKSC